MVISRLWNREEEPKQIPPISLSWGDRQTRFGEGQGRYNLQRGMSETKSFSIEICLGLWLNTVCARIGWTSTSRLRETTSEERAITRIVIQTIFRAHTGPGIIYIPFSQNEENSLDRQDTQKSIILAMHD